MAEKTIEQKNSSWTTWVALSTAGMAVLAALTTLYMGKFSSRTILAQAQESDQWAFYQAKSIKGHTFEMQKQHMELEALTLKGKISKDLAEKFEKTIKGYEENIKRYDVEKKEIKDKAGALEKEKQTAQTRGGKFAFGLIFLQIAIMLSSISVITKKRPLWYFGIALTSVGLFFFLDGFYLFY
ncbi:DUF4337 domain-containing protein [bacterium]|nr:MAG: DUF4337 domain-containing protein [bacterium]